MAHTKGEWKREEGYETEIWCGGILIADQVLPENVPIIEAAPKLLEACRMLVYEIEWHQENSSLVLVGLGQERVREAKAAIKTALGEEGGSDEQMD